MGEILRNICRISIELLPCVDRIVHEPIKWESNCHREVSIVYQCLKAEKCLEFYYRLSVVCNNQRIEFIDNVIDTCNAVLGSEFLN